MLDGHSARSYKRRFPRSGRKDGRSSDGHSRFGRKTHPTDRAAHRSQPRAAEPHSDLREKSRDRHRRTRQGRRARRLRRSTARAAERGTQRCVASEYRRAKIVAALGAHQSAVERPHRTKDGPHALELRPFLIFDCAWRAHRDERRSCHKSKRIWHVHLSVILPAAVALIYIRFQEAASASRQCRTLVGTLRRKRCANQC